MNRRRFLTYTALVGTTGIISCNSSPSNKSESGEEAVKKPYINKNRVKKLSMVTTWPKNFPGLGTSAEALSETIKTLSNGELEIKVYASGELVPAFESFDAVSQGIADMYHAADYYWQGKSPAYNFFASIPLGMNSIEVTSWLEYGGGQALWEELSAQFNIIGLQACNTGHQMGGWFKREIRSLDDFKGLKMRMPGWGGQIIRELGGAAVTLAGSEIYQALQSGVIDATEWVGPWNDLAMGFYKEAPYYYAPGFHEPGTILSLGINLKLWNNLSPFHQTLIRTACRSQTLASLAEFNTKNSIALKTLTKTYHVKLRSFSDEIWKKISPIAKNIIQQQSQSDSLSRRIYDSYMKSYRLQKDWSTISEADYMQKRILADQP